MKKEDRFCVDCGKRGVVERKRCGDCAKKFNKERARRYYLKRGAPHIRIEKCPICNQDMKVWREGQVSHLGCRLKLVEDYNKIKRSKDGKSTIGRKFVEDMGVIIPKGYVVHHVDGNPSNNDTTNLWILSLKAHSHLHRYLQSQWSLWLKNHGSNSENCRKALIVQMTTAWLETTCANVIKISEIGRPAAEPLSR
jgi:hypothetical protein